MCHLVADHLQKSGALPRVFLKFQVVKDQEFLRQAHFRSHGNGFGSCCEVSQNGSGLADMCSSDEDFGGGYSEAQVKIISAISNDASYLKDSQMDEIAQMTYDRCIEAVSHATNDLAILFGT